AHRGRAAAHLSRERVLLHVSPQVRRAGADHPRRRRAVAGRLVAARRPPAAHLDRGVRRLRLGWMPRDFNNILRLARDLFPDAADYDRGQYRACLRPMTPDGPPILGLGRHRNLFLNCGHGHMGWTMACGTARIVADLMT